MKKLLLALIALPMISFGQSNLDSLVNFDVENYWTLSTTNNTSYGTHTYIVPNSFSMISTNKIVRETPDALQEGIVKCFGTYGIRMRNEAEAAVQFKIPAGGIEKFQFKVRRWRANNPAINIVVSWKAESDATWNSLATINPAFLQNSNDWTLYEATLNTPQNNVLIKIEQGSPYGERIMIDDFSWNKYPSAPQPCSITIADISALTCNNNGTELVTTDDKVQFTLDVSATSGGANGYTVTTSEYAVVGTNSGVFGAPTIFTLEEGSVAGDDFTITVTSIDSTACSFTSATIVNATVECSTPPSACDLTSAAVTAIACDTGADINDASDDAINFTLNVQGVVTSPNGYTITANAGTLSVAEGAYNTPLAITITGAGTGNVVLTIVDADDLNCTITTTVTNPGLCSGPSAITAASTSLTFTHMVETPSASQNVAVTGNYLTSDITATASTGFEVSANNTTFGTTATLTATNNAVAAPIYVRANSLATGSFTGTVTLSSANATDIIINLTNTATGYTSYTIDQINGTDPTTGVADSVDVLVKLAGIVQCMDYRAGGYSMVIIDGSNKGINVYKGTNVSGYTAPQGGDSIIVKGKIVTYRGLLQIEANEITLVNQGNAQLTPVAVTTLDESTENLPVVINNVTLVAGQEYADEGVWHATQNLKFTNGTNVFEVRAAGTPLAGQPLPNGPVNITGIASQFALTTTAPYSGGYQLLICNEDAVEIVCAGANLPNAITSVIGGTIHTIEGPFTYKWINCEDDSVIEGETTPSFTPQTPGEYKVEIDNGNCTNTSACVSMGLSIANTELAQSITAFPNPIADQLTIKNLNNVEGTFTIVDVNGKVIETVTSLKATQVINTSAWNKGVYFVNFVSNTNATYTLKVIK